MMKLIAHLLVALALWFLLASFGLPISVRCGAIVVGAVIVHWVWQRLFPDPFLYLGAMPVSKDDPLMMEARRLAIENLPSLRKLFPDHQHDTTVRFGLQVKSGNTEHVWGDLLELGEETAKVYLRTPPVEEADIQDRNLTIPVADIDDWQIEMTDGAILGGYTNQALFRIFERERGPLPEELRVQQQRFRSV